MSIKIGEIGREYYISTAFDLSSFSELAIKFTSPSGESFEKLTADGVSAPSAPSPALPAGGGFAGGVMPADTYILYITDGTEFDEAGDWTVCVRYEDATPKKFFGDDAVLTILSAC